MSPPQWRLNCWATEKFDPADRFVLIGETMHPSALRTNTLLRGITLSAFLLIAGFNAASAQSGPDQKAQDQSKPQTPAVPDTREGQKRADEFEEAAKAINGPAGNPECVWLGRRVVNLMWRDDLDTAFRHLDLYDRFGCPGGHVQATFRCLVRFGATIDNKIADTLNTRIQACWINPNAQPQPAAANAPAPAAPPAPAAAPAPAPAK
jgi:hypothetical protein